MLLSCQSQFPFNSTAKNSTQNAPKLVFLAQKSKNFMGRGTPDFSPSGEGDTPPYTSPPPRLLLLDPRTYGGRLDSRLRRSTSALAAPLPQASPFAPLAKPSGSALPPAGCYRLYPLLPCYLSFSATIMSSHTPVMHVVAKSENTLQLTLIEIL